MTIQQQGFAAYKQGKSLAENPYIGNWRKAEEWKLGWDAAFNLDRLREVVG